MRVKYVIVFVSDMSRSVSFYRDVVGLSLKFQSDGWSEFATEGATWALHKSDDSNSENKNSEMEPAGRCRSGFQVPNLEKFHKRMVELKVPCNQEPMEVFGAKIAQYVDPDGMVFSVGEETSDN